MTEGGEIPATDRRNDGEGQNNMERDDEKIPPRPPLSKWGMPDIAGRMEGGGGRERDLKGNVYWWT